MMLDPEASSARGTRTRRNKRGSRSAIRAWVAEHPARGSELSHTSPFAGRQLASSLAPPAERASGAGHDYP